MRSNRHGEVSQRKIEGMRILGAAFTKALKEGKTQKITRSIRKK